MGWPLRKRAQYGEFGGSFDLPDGRRHGLDRLRRRARVPRTSSSPRTTCCRSSRRTGSSARSSTGGERVAWGAKTITEGGLALDAAKLNAPGLLLVGDGAGLVNVPRLKGVHYAIESGRLAAEAAFAALQRGEVAGPERRARRLRRGAPRRATSGRTCTEVRNMRQAFDKGFFIGGALASAMTVTKGKLPPKDFDDAPERRARRSCGPGARRATRRRTASSPSTSSRPSSPPATGRATTSRTTSASRRSVPRDVAEMWALDVPGAGLRGRGGGRRRHRRGARRRRRTASSAARSAPRAAG